MDNSMKLSTALSALTSDKLSAEEKQTQYGVLSVQLHNASASDLPKLLKASSIKTLQHLVVSDILSSHIDTAQVALQVLGLCLHDCYIVEQFTDLDSLIAALCNVIITTTDKTCCTRALWCFSKQNMPEACIRKKLLEILKAIEHGQCKKNFQSLTVEYEALCAVVRLLDQVPADMKSHAVCWGKLVYPLLLHDAVKIRQQALVAMDKGLQAMMKHQDELLSYLLPDLKPDIKSDVKVKSLLLSQMSKLMNSKLEMHVLKVWALYMKLLGKSVHHGSLINSLLPIVEQGFKNSSPEVKVMAYRAWKELISNFALNKDIISDPKRIKLVMQVFRINNARHESVALEKLDVWWHFICCLKEAASLYFDVVCLPLLQYAISGQLNLTGLTPGKTPTRLAAVTSLASPVTPTMAVSGTGSPTQTYHSVQLRGCEMLAHVLGKVKCDPDNYSPHFTIVPEHSIIVGTAFFVKHHASILGMVKQYLIQLGHQIDDFLLRHIWQKSLDHVKNVIQNGSKHDSVDVLQMFLQIYEDLVENQTVSPEILLKLLETLLSLPSQVLSSSSYSLGGTVLMQHNGALFLMGCMLHHRILETVNNSSRFYTIFDQLVLLALTHESSGLHVAEKILDLLQAAVPNMEKADSLAKLWMSLANPLNQLVLKTGDVNQGTGLEYDFTCVLNVLAFPIREILPAKPSQATQNSMLKCWSKFYGTFARLAALVGTAPSNIACEGISSRIHPFVTKERLMDEMFLNALSQLLITILEPVDFSSISEPSHFGFAGSGQVSKKKESGLQNLISFVHLTDNVLMAALDLAEQPEDNAATDIKKSRSSVLSSAFFNLIQVLTSLFTHLVTSEAVTALIGILSASLGRFYETVGKKHRRGISQYTITKAEKLLQDLITCLQVRYSGHYDSEFLEQLLPLLRATFVHPRQKIKSQMLIFWNLTFARAMALVYPDKLKPILMKVKEKAAIILPGWSTTQVSSVQETPSSMLSQSESQVSVSDVIGVRSPHKLQGSFLNKIKSDSVKSPLRRDSNLTKGTEGVNSPKIKVKSRISLSINDLKEDEFVVIQSSKKKHVLTNHQKEVLKERSTIPALYSNVDGSQDLSLMAKFVSTESQMSMSDMTCPTSLELGDFKNGSNPEDSVDKVDNPNASTAKSSTRRKSVRFVSNPGNEKENLSDVDRQNIESIKSCLVTRKLTSDSNCSEVNEIEDSSQDSASVIGRIVKRLGETTDTSSSSNTDENLQISDNNFFSSESSKDDRSVSNLNLSQSSTSGSKGLTSSCRSLNSSLLDGIAEETVSEMAMEKKPVQLQILAEESQMMPLPLTSLTDASEKCSDDDIIEETPQKKVVDGLVAGEVDLCTKKLFTVNNTGTGLVQESQDEPETAGRGLVPYSETQSSLRSNSDASVIVSGDLIFDSVKSGVDITSPALLHPVKLASVQLSPVVSLQRLSNEEVLTYSPKCSAGGNERKRRRSFRTKVNEKSDIKDVKSAEEQNAGLLFGDSAKVQQNADVPKSISGNIQSAELSEKTCEETTAEADSDSVFIVEMHGTLENNSGGESTQNLELKSCAGPEISSNDCCIDSNPHRLISQDKLSSDAKTGSSDSPVSSPRCSGRVRKTPVRLRDPSLSNSNRRKRRSSQIGSDYSESNKSNHCDGEHQKQASQNSTSSSSQDHPIQKLQTQTSQDDNSSEKQTPELRLGDESTLADDVSSETSLFSSDDKEPGPSSKISDSKSQSDDKKQDLPVAQIQDVDKNSHEAAAGSAEGGSQSCPSLALNQEGVETCNHPQSSVDRDRVLQQCDNKADELFSSDDELPLISLSQKGDLVTDADTKRSLQSSGTDLGREPNSEKWLKSSSGRKSKAAVKRTNTAASSVRNRTRLSLRTQASASRILRSSGGKAVLSKTARRTGSQRQMVHRRLNKLQQSKGMKQVESKLENEFQIAEERKMDAAKSQVASQAQVDVKKNVDDVTAAVSLKGLQDDAISSASQLQNTPQEVTGVLTSDGMADAEKLGEKEECTFVVSEREIIQTNPDTGKLNKFVSPLRSPPRRGKLFANSENGSSHSKHTLLSRASLILQRAKMTKPTPQPVQHGRGPLTISQLTIRERPGILKSPNSESPRRPGLLSRLASHRQMSPSTNFRPIHLPRIYSPSASPSAGILRKRKLSGTVPTDSPSPPNKQRRVCFNDTVETREIPSAQKHKAKARMVGRGSPKPVNRCLAMPQNGAMPLSPLIHWPDSEVVGREEKHADSEISESSAVAVVEVTPESQLNCKLPICPQYMDCDLPIDCILPQLTSTVWSVGLGQLIRAMDIKTVGHLSALSEQQVHNLPIKSPKVQTVREALRVVAGRRTRKPNQNHEAKSPVSTSESLCISPTKDLDSSIGSTVCDPDVESRDLLDDIRHLDNSLKSTPPSSPEPDDQSPHPAQTVLHELVALRNRCSLQTLTNLPSSQLMEMFTGLNIVINNVVQALKDKCPNSPQNSQS